MPAGPPDELDDETAHVVVRRRGRRSQPHDAEGAVTEVGDVLAAEAVDVAEGRLVTVLVVALVGHAERLLAQEHAGVGVVVVHVGGDAVSAGEDGSTTAAR